MSKKAQNIFKKPKKKNLKFKISIILFELNRIFEFQIFDFSDQNQVMISIIRKTESPNFLILVDSVFYFSTPLLNMTYFTNNDIQLII